MGTIGDGYENPLIESIWSRMQIELLDHKKWTTRTELEVGTATRLGALTSNVPWLT